MNKNEEENFNEWELFQLESDEVREIILMFMTFKCDKIINETHFLECPGFHVDGLKRRNPFFEGKLLYTSEICFEKEKTGFCNLVDKCRKSHNKYEVLYHPSKFRTSPCEQKHVVNYKYCPFAHSKEQLRIWKNYDKAGIIFGNPININLTNTSIQSDFFSNENSLGNQLFKKNSLQYEESADFDLLSFKTLACLNSIRHNEKQCLFYHSNKDRRRQLMSHRYSSELCPRSEDEKECPYRDMCIRCHNRVEQFYHPEKFKSKYCSHFGENIGLCPYGIYCSFAHSEDEIRIQLIHKHSRNQDFFLFYFKTIWCPFNNHHDKSSCPYAHNWQDYRRSPIEYNYTENLCNQWDIRKTILNYSDGCKNEYR